MSNSTAGGGLCGGDPVWGGPSAEHVHRTLSVVLQVVTCNGHILEKPNSLEEARQFISAYGPSRPCSTVGSLVLTDTSTGQRVQAVDTATIHFSAVPDTVVEALLAEGTCLQCAGALMVENPHMQPCIARIEGTKDTVMGLCKESLVRLSRELGASAKAPL